MEIEPELFLLSATIIIKGYLPFFCRLHDFHIPNTCNPMYTPRLHCSTNSIVLSSAIFCSYTSSLIAYNFEILLTLSPA